MAIGQVMIDVDGLVLSEEDRALLQHPQVGGLILFSRNYENPEQLRALVDEVRSLKTEIIIAVDQEGGRVQRFKEGFSKLAPLGDLGKAYDQNPSEALFNTKTHARQMVSELRDVGVDLSFTPVLDLDMGISSVIGDRSFHADPSVIVTLATAYIETMHTLGMPATGKHFPGHGAVVADSHYDLPIDPRDFETINETDLVPFKVLAPMLDAMMIAHVVYNAVSDLPAGLDPFWLNEVLRDRCGFSGVIFSDDLSMGALKTYGSMSERASLALAAGCDMILVCNDRPATKEVLDHLGTQSNPLSQQRLERLLSFATISA